MDLEPSEGKLGQVRMLATKVMALQWALQRMPLYQKGAGSITGFDLLPTLPMWDLDLRLDLHMEQE